MKKQRKKCTVCGKMFAKNKYVCKKQWSKTEYCGTKCAGIARIGHKASKSAFKKGSIPWNKNKSVRLNDCLIKWREAGNGEGEKHPNWKGDKAGYSAIHIWVKSRKKRPEMCEECGKKKNYSLHLSNVDHKYSRNIEDYRYLCASCHKLYDLEKGLVSH